MGASGYTGLELIKLLINHRYFEITYVATTTGDMMLSALHPSLDKVFDIEVQKADIEQMAKMAKVIFLALPHKESMKFVKALRAYDVKIIDLSADYRLEMATYESFYTEHIDKEGLNFCAYGLPEFYSKEIADAQIVANPGCYPTSVLLPLMPIANDINSDFPLFIDAKSGVSGAGKKCSEKTHYVSINDNFFAYSPLKHRHAPEIKEKLHQASQKSFDVKFVPHLLPATRGMLSSIYCMVNKEVDIKAKLQEYYKDSPFVRLKSSPVDIKSVAGTNFCDIYVAQEAQTLYISSAIDNLMRGASSQAVVNANIVCGFDEDESIPKIAYVP